MDLLKSFGKFLAKILLNYKLEELFELTMLLLSLVVTVSGLTSYWFVTTAETTSYEGLCDVHEGTTVNLYVTKLCGVPLEDIGDNGFRWLQLRHCFYAYAAISFFTVLMYFARLFVEMFYEEKSDAPRDTDGEKDSVLVRIMKWIRKMYNKIMPLLFNITMLCILIALLILYGEAPKPKDHSSMYIIGMMIFGMCVQVIRCVRVMVYAFGKPTFLEDIELNAPESRLLSGTKFRPLPLNRHEQEAIKAYHYLTSATRWG